MSGFTKSLRTHSTEHGGHRAEAARDDGKLQWKRPRPEAAMAGGKVTSLSKLRVARGTPRVQVAEDLRLTKREASQRLHCKQSGMERTSKAPQMSPANVAPQNN